MTDGLTIHSTPFEDALLRLASTSKRNTVELLRQQAKLVFVNVAKYTPPASSGATGLQAERQGKAKVAADIRSLYGTPGDAYDAITTSGGAAQADAFWFLHQQGDDDAAAGMVRAATGKSFSDFDGGTLHGRTGGGRKRRRREREHVFYVRNPQSLESYIQQEESHVWWLASGWKSALLALGGKIPFGVGKHNAPGALRVSVTDKRIEITMGNDVSYGSDVRGMERRIYWAMNIQTQKLDRRWEHYLKTAAREAGFRK